MPVASFLRVWQVRFIRHRQENTSQTERYSVPFPAAEALLHSKGSAYGDSAIEKDASRSSFTAGSEPAVSARPIYALAIVIFVYGWLSVNIYLPILPELDGIFGITPQTAKLTVTIFLIGFSLTQLVWGPLSDRFGRKPILLTGIAVSATGATFAGLADSIYLFIAARFLESLGLGVGPVLARSVLTDVLDKAHVAIAMAYVAIVVALVPAVAPIVAATSRSCSRGEVIFFFLALYGIALLLVTQVRFRETIKHKRSDLHVSGIALQYLNMIRNRRYFGYTFMYCVAFGSLVGYYASAPYIFINVLDYTSHEYGYLLLLNVMFYVLGVLACRLAVPKIGPDRMLLLSMCVYACSTAVFAILEIYSTISTMGVLVPMCIFIFGSGLVSPAANAGAMTLFKESAGASTAVVGFSMAMGGAISTALLSHFHVTRLWELAAYVGISTLIMIGTYIVFLRKRTAASALPSATGS